MITWNNSAIALADHFFKIIKYVQLLYKYAIYYGDESISS